MGLPIILAVGFMFVPPAAAQAVDGPLQRQHVRDYIRLRVESHQLQEKMKANADQYDALIQAFYERRAALLKKEGWTADAFDALQERIMRAETALEMVADSAEYRAQQQADIRAFKQSPHMTAEERKEALAEVARMDSIRQARHIDPTRRDWPAVRPYLDALEHLVDYVALNRPDPPNMSELPPATP
jgi:hypothetical protein